MLSQSKRWSWRNYWREVRAGWSLVFDELLTILAELGLRRAPTSSRDRPDELTRGGGIGIGGGASRLQLGESNLIEVQNNDPASLWSDDYLKVAAGANEGAERSYLRRKMLHGLQFVARRNSSTAPAAAAAAAAEGTGPSAGPEAGDERQPATLTYGVTILSQICSLVGHWMFAFILDTRRGLLPSRNFIIVSYAAIVFGAPVGLACTKWVLEPALVNILFGRANNFLSWFILVSSFCYISYTFTTLFTFLYHRREVQEFALYHCSIITLPKRFQRRKMIQLFVTFYLFVTGLEPMLIVLILIYEPNLLPVQLAGRLTWLPNLLVRCITITFISAGVLLLSTSTMIVPLFTCYLIICAAQHLKDLLRKQLARFNRIDGITLNSFLLKARPNDQLSALLDAKTSRLICDYSCDTLTFDWPDLLEEAPELGEAELAALADVAHPTSSAPQNDGATHRSRTTRDYSQLLDASASAPGEPAHKRQYLSRLKQYLAKMSPGAELASHSLSLNSQLTCGSSEQSLVSLNGADTRLQLQQPTSRLIVDLDHLGPPAQSLWPHPACGGVSDLSATRKQSLSTASAAAEWREHNFNSTPVGLLFLYKNLIKSLSELKGMISIFERRFGLYHLVVICIDSLLIAQWVTTAITESRIRREMSSQRDNNGTSEAAAAAASRTLASALVAALTNNKLVPAAKPVAVAEQSAFESLGRFFEQCANLTPSQARVAVLSIVFTLSNIYVFLRCDCLADGLVKLRCQLFKMNINQACLALAPFDHLRQGAWRAHCPHLQGPQQEACARSSTLLAAKRRHSAAQNWPVPLDPTNDWAELDQVWSLYDQVIRVSKRANFRLTAGTEYSKRCLLFIFGRTVSLILVCIQIIDIYSYT